MREFPPAKFDPRSARTAEEKALEIEESSRRLARIDPDKWKKPKNPAYGTSQNGR